MPNGLYFELHNFVSDQGEGSDSYPHSIMNVSICSSSYCFQTSLKDVTPSAPLSVISHKLGFCDWRQVPTQKVNHFSLIKLVAIVFPI